MMKQAGTATHIAQAIELGNTKAKYDTEVKNILSDKIILAWILKYTVKELRDYDIDTIKDCIEGEPEISKLPVYANTITDYRLVPDKLAGDYAEEAKYDLLSVVMVCLGKDVIYEKSPTLLGLLSVLLSHQLTAEEKKERLERTYRIDMTEKLEREMNLMCNLSDLLEECRIEKGIAQGIEKAWSKEHLTSNIAPPFKCSRTE